MDPEDMSNKEILTTLRLIIYKQCSAAPNQLPNNYNDFNGEKAGSNPKVIHTETAELWWAAEYSNLYPNMSSKPCIFAFHLLD